MGRSRRWKAAQWDAVIRTNLDGFYNVLRPVIMPMVRRRAPGRIVTISSVAGIIGNRGQVNYSAAKAGHHRRNKGACGRACIA